MRSRILQIFCVIGFISRGSVLFLISNANVICIFYELKNFDGYNFSFVGYVNKCNKSLFVFVTRNVLSSIFNFRPFCFDSLFHMPQHSSLLHPKLKESNGRNLDVIGLGWRTKTLCGLLVKYCNHVHTRM